MGKTYNYQNHSYIGQAMQIHNSIMPGPKFTLLDYNILCLVKSFNETGNSFYMSNDQLAKELFSCEKTIRSSIKRLCEYKLLKKEYIENNRLKGRYLIYQEENVNKLVSEMKIATSR